MRCIGPHFIRLPMRCITEISMLAPGPGFRCILLNTFYSIPILQSTCLFRAIQFMFYSMATCSRYILCFHTPVLSNYILQIKSVPKLVTFFINYIIGILSAITERWKCPGIVGSDLFTTVPIRPPKEPGRIKSKCIPDRHAFTLLHHILCRL